MFKKVLLASTFFLGVMAYSFAAEAECANPLTSDLFQGLKTNFHSVYSYIFKNIEYVTYQTNIKDKDEDYLTVVLGLVIDTSNQDKTHIKFSEVCIVSMGFTNDVILKSAKSIQLFESNKQDKSPKTPPKDLTPDGESNDQ